MHRTVPAARPRNPVRHGAQLVGGALIWAGVVAGQRAAEAAGALVRRSQSRGDRGDVPGWVLVTLMTAGLVTALWVVARDRLTSVFERAITSVTGQ